MNKEQLISFEKEIAKLWEEGEIRTPVHFSGGNEEQLIEIFKSIKKDDYIFTTHRSHYHALLKGMNPEILKKKILNGESMHIFDNKLKIYSSSILAGTCPIAVGVALALKKKKSINKVWCFIGDGACDEGGFFEAYRYAVSNELPISFIIEDNNRSVETTVEDRWNSHYSMISVDTNYWQRYSYISTYPHVGTGKWVTFI